MIYNAVTRGMASLLQLILSHVYGEGRHGSPDQYSCNTLNVFWSSPKPSTGKLNIEVICQYIFAEIPVLIVC
jgi:hypothetical protein